MEEFLPRMTGLITTSGLKIVAVVLILILGRIIAGISRGVLKRAMTRSDQDPGLTSFAGNLTYGLVMLFAVVAALAKFGIQTASFVAVLGAAGFAVGFALQGSLANFASGVMLLVFRPFKVGDFVEAAGVAGTIQEIQLFNTILSTPDNVRVTVPNAKMYGDVIKNYSANDTRRVDLLIGIGYGSSIDKATKVAHELIRTDSRILSDPGPMVAVSELADSSVNLVIRSWVKKEDYWDVKFDLTRKIKEAFDRDNIEIPFPQQVVHHVNPPGQN